MSRKQQREVGLVPAGRLVREPVGADQTAGVIDYGTARPFPDARMRRQVQLRDAQCRFPDSTKPATGAQLDHIVARAHGGPTADANLQVLYVNHHVAKRHSHWPPELDAESGVAPGTTGCSA